MPSKEDIAGTRNPTHNPNSSNFSECEKAANILDSFINPKVDDGGIPRKILTRAKALIICSLTRWGFIGSGRFGSGVIVLRLPNGNWSAPSAVSLAGLGLGPLLGVESTDFVFVLSTDEAVEKFIQSGYIHLGLNLSLALGSGRSTESGGIAGSKGISGFYSYSKTRGVYAGISAEFGLVLERSSANKRIYDRKLKAAHLATGQVPVPRAAERLMSILNSDGVRITSITSKIAADNPDASGLQSLGREMPHPHELADLSNLGPGLSENDTSEAHWSGLSSPGLTKPRHLNRVPRELQGDTYPRPDSADTGKPAEPSPVFELDPQHTSMIAASEDFSRDESMRSSTVASSHHMSLQSSVGNPLEREASLLTTPGIPESPTKEEHHTQESTGQVETA
ncbi:SH3 domain-containing protein [Penicillium malachiteum]|uniref:SH3 domain-containing protein n=1 Tax=Penicillium malachiteum TaxID=1324776 RepID=UPI0025494D25|nr:SH3 domain-containing protein [Penicillium malachiteum]KAJ5736118.1 SH3 domain-containing protein [Penicillium malachiteum]